MCVCVKRRKRGRGGIVYGEESTESLLGPDTREESDARREERVAAEGAAEGAAAAAADGALNPNRPLDCCLPALSKMVF